MSGGSGGVPAFSSAEEMNRWADATLASLDAVLDEVVHNMLKDDDDTSKTSGADGSVAPPGTGPPPLTNQDTSQAVPGIVVKTVSHQCHIDSSRTIGIIALH